MPCNQFPISQVEIQLYEKTEILHATNRLDHRSLPSSTPISKSSSASMSRLMTGPGAGVFIREQSGLFLDVVFVFVSEDTMGDGWSGDGS